MMVTLYSKQFCSQYDASIVIYEIVDRIKIADMQFERKVAVIRDRKEQS